MSNGSSSLCFVFPTLRVLIDSDGRDHRFCGAWWGEAGGGAAPRVLGSPGLDNLVIPFALQYVRTYICHRHHEGCRYRGPSPPSPPPLTNQDRIRSDPNTKRIRGVDRSLATVLRTYYCTCTHNNPSDLPDTSHSCRKLGTPYLESSFSGPILLLLLNANPNPQVLTFCQKTFRRLQ